MLGGWTVLFATCVGWLTNARRDQIFAATAAYAAVLVVFVSGTLGGAPNSVVLGSWTCTQSETRNRISEGIERMKKFQTVPIIGGACSLPLIPTLKKSQNFTGVLN